MKIKLKDAKRIIREEVEKQYEKIVKIAQESNPGPETDPKKETEELPEEREEDVEEALKSLDETEILKLAEQILEDNKEIFNKLFD